MSKTKNEENELWEMSACFLQMSSAVIAAVVCDSREKSKKKQKTDHRILVKIELNLNMRKQNSAFSVIIWDQHLCLMTSSSSTNSVYQDRGFSVC